MIWSLDTSTKLKKSGLSLRTFQGHRHCSYANRHLRLVYCHSSCWRHSLASPSTFISFSSSCAVKARTSWHSFSLWSSLHLIVGNRQLFFFRLALPSSRWECVREHRLWMLVVTIRTSVQSRETTLPQHLVRYAHPNYLLLLLPYSSQDINTQVFPASWNTYSTSSRIPKAPYTSLQL